MESGPIVEVLDEGKDIALGLGAGLVLAMADELCLQGMQEALHRSVCRNSQPCDLLMRLCGRPAAPRDNRGRRIGRITSGGRNSPALEEDLNGTVGLHMPDQFAHSLEGWPTDRPQCLSLAVSERSIGRSPVLPCWRRSASCRVQASRCPPRASQLAKARPAIAFRFR